MKLYVGNLPFSTSDEELRDLFTGYGEVVSVAIIKDKETGRSRGFGFVEMPNDGDAQKAIQGLNGTAFNQRNLVVNQARPREERSDSRSGGGYSDRRRNDYRPRKDSGQSNKGGW